MAAKIDVTEPGPEIRIAVRNFGPISEGGIDLRPLTIFVGPSNTGKTYLAVLIYAFHRVLGGFPKFPPVLDYLPHDPSSILEPNILKRVENVIDKLDPASKESRFFDLDEEDRGIIQSALTKPEYLGSDLTKQLARCFGLESVSDLIRTSGADNEARVSLEIGESAEIPWNFHLDILASGIHTDGRIEDFDLHRISAMFEEAASKILSAKTISGLLANLSDLSERAKTPGAYYLPADRSGIMHSHRIIASSLIQHAAGAAFAPLSFSGVMADFMQQLIHYEEPSPHADGRPPQSPMGEIADAMERRTLGGSIRPVTLLPGGYPEFVYRPQAEERDIRLSRASSMVSELAPVVLLVRGGVRPGDTLLVDEPEAHLHPAAQTEMAIFLARLVRAGVRVVITTHSDWLLHEIGNLMRAGALSETTGESEPDSEGFLRPDEVGVWLFRREGDAEGSTIREIPFDPVEGVQPGDYEDVAEQLYNRSADLQNRLEEAAARGKTQM